MKTAVAGMCVPATAISLGDDIHFSFFARIFFISPIPPFQFFCFVGFILGKIYGKAENIKLALIFLKAFI